MIASLPSHRIGIEYLEHCRVVAADERLSYVRKEGAVERYWSIPYGNTAVLLLGPGTSLTQQAARLLGSQGVVVGFCGGGGTPVYMGSLNEYRATHYLQAWVKIWQVESARVEATRIFQQRRLALLPKAWRRLDTLVGFTAATLISEYQVAILNACTNQDFLTAEGAFTKQLYRLLAQHYGMASFKREADAADKTNTFLTQGNYLCYGLAASVLWVLGIPHSLPLNHGQTRRGALVFDVADLIKNACVTPLAFECARTKATTAQFRNRCLTLLDEVGALAFLFETIAATAKFEDEVSLIAGETPDVRSAKISGASLADGS